MKDGFDYDPPEGPLDCCAGMSRHGRLLQETKPASQPAKATPRAGKPEDKLREVVTAPRE